MVLLGARLPGVGSRSGVLLRRYLSTSNANRASDPGITPPGQDVPIESETAQRAGHEEFLQLVQEELEAGSRISHIPPPKRVAGLNIRRLDGKAVPKAIPNISRTKQRSLARPQPPFKSSPLFQISKEVEDGIKYRGPVVALETTIYTHGFPYPDNVALALDLEAIVRRNGGIPATIGVIDGIARIGMNEEQLRTLASSAGKPETMKVSRRDLPYILGMVRYFLRYQITHDSFLSSSIQ